MENLPPESPLTKQPEKSNEDKVEAYIGSHSDGTTEVLEKMYLFLKEKKITHYISGIDLGAAVYSVSVISKCKSHKGAKIEAGVEYLAGIGTGTKSTLERKQKWKRDRKIGDIDIVKRGKGEEVLKYHLLPVFTLICSGHKRTKMLLQRAIQFYLQSSSELFCQKW